MATVLENLGFIIGISHATKSIKQAGEILGSLSG